MRMIPIALATILFALPGHAQEVDRSAINRIVDQGLNHSEVMETAAYLTDRIGGRMTNSPQMRAAEAWTQQRFRDWGLSATAEPYRFGRGWSINRASARMTSPRVIELGIIPVAWTPATNGTIRAPIVVAPIDEEEDFAEWRGKLAGKIVLVDRPGTGSEPGEAPFQRLGGDDLSKLDEFRQPRFSPLQVEETLKKADFDEKRDAFLKAEGALAWVSQSYRDGGLLHGEGYGYEIGRTPTLPGVEMVAEDYRRLARLAKTDAAPTLELLSDVTFHDEDPNAYNIIADLKGTGAKPGYVMAGAHLDSWVAGDGATDNGAGSAVVMEAARILSAIGAKPKRTIRFALWSGEEQALLGSMAYVERHFATRGRVDPRWARVNPYYTWRQRWPITLQAGHRDLAAYFNIDNGSGKVRGIYAEGNVAAVPTLERWLSPFASMGTSTVAIQQTGGTDHVFMQAVGLPGFQFIQDPLDYESRTHHSNVDTYDHLKAEDLRQAAVILASVLLSAANADEPLPRRPVPTEPRPADPFEYPAED